MAGPDMRTIKSAHRVLEILEYFDENHRSATVMEMSRALAYPQSSTSELLRCLTRLGYLHYNRFRRTYSPTSRVVLLGSWVDSPLRQRGPVLEALDEVAHSTGETALLSTAANYVVQHLHIAHGGNEHAVDARVGDSASLLHSAQGRLLLSTYMPEQIRSALHRLNAEEEDPERRVRLAETVAELGLLREKGWMISHGEDGRTTVAALLKPRRGMDRLVISVVAEAAVMERESEHILGVLLEKRDELNAMLHQSGERGERKPCEIIPFADKSWMSGAYQRSYA